MNMIGKRIKELRNARGLTQEQLGLAVGVKRVSVSKWESQADVFNKPRGEHLFKLCQILKTTAEFLLYGYTSYEEYQANGIHIRESIGLYLRKIPLLEWKHLKNIESLSDEDLQGQTIISHQETSQQGYALPVQGDSMVAFTGPYSFPEGVIIIFDPNWSEELTDGIFVIAQTGKTFQFRQVKFDGSKPHLKPLNQEYPKTFEPFKIIGKVTEMQMKLP